MFVRFKPRPPKLHMLLLREFFWQLTIRSLQFRVLYSGSLFSETPPFGSMPLACKSALSSLADWSSKCCPASRLLGPAGFYEAYTHRLLSSSF